MTLVVATTLPDGAVWMGSERRAGGDNYTDLAGPKVFELETPDQVQYLIGFAGSPRVAQTIIAVTPPAREAQTRSLHWWLTEYCDTIRERAEAMSILVDPGGREGGQLAGDSEALVAIDGHVVRIGCDLAWEEPARGWESMGVAAWTFDGAHTVLRDQGVEPVDAARTAWQVARRFHGIGPLTDEITLYPKA